MENITNQFWIRWHPEKELAEKYDLVCFSEDSEKKFELILSEEKTIEKKIKILFENQIDIFRITDESFRYNTFSDIIYKYGYDFHVTWTFFKVYNSELLTWLSKQSTQIIDPTKLIHYCIITSELIIYCFRT